MKTNRLTLIRGWAAALLLATALLMPQAVAAYDFMVGGLCYNKNSDGTSVTVTYKNSSSPRYTDLTGDLVIPETITYNGATYSVTSIGMQAFSGCIGLTGELLIPNSVTSIGQDAFWGCSGLTSVTIPNSVTFIGNYAFYHCSGLESMVVAAGNSTYDSRDNCNAIIETATNTLVAGCKTTTIPNSVTSIGYSAFENCSGLTSVTIPNSVTSIGEYAFKDCSGLTSVTIGNSVTNLDLYAFQNCSGLTSVTWNAISCNNNYSYFSPFSYSASGITSFTFGNDVEKIPSGLCADLTGLSSIIIPNSVTSIGEKAFRDCSGLISVTIGNSVTSIGENAFYNCGKLSSVHISDLEKWCNISFGGSTNYYYSTDDTYANPISIAKHLYLNGTEVEDLVIPNSVITINKLAFYSCYGLKSVTIPNSVTTIGDGAFGGCI